MIHLLFCAEITNWRKEFTECLSPISGFSSKSEWTSKAQQTVEENSTKKREELFKKSLTSTEIKEILKTMIDSYKKRNNRVKEEPSEIINMTAEIKRLEDNLDEISQDIKKKYSRTEKN